MLNNAWRAICEGWVLIPDGWERKTIGEICDFSNGHGFRPPDWSSEGLPIIRIQNLTGSKDFNYYAGEPEPDWLVEPGTILFAWAGTKGVSFGPSIWNGPLAVLNQHIFRIHPKVELDRAWLFGTLQLVTKRVEQLAHGFKSTLLHVRKSDITEQAVLFPPLPEQRAIAKILSTWDEAIALTEQLIAAVGHLKKGLMQQLLTGQTRFPEFVEEWELRLLGELAEFTAGGTPSTRIEEYWGGDVRWMNSGEINLKRFTRLRGE